MTVWVMVAIFLARSSHNLLADTGNLKLLLLYHRLNLAPLKFASWLLIKACHLLLFPSIYWPQLPGDSILKSFFREYLYFPLKSSLYHLLIEYNFEFLDARFKPVSSPPPQFFVQLSSCFSTVPGQPLLTTFSSWFSFQSLSCNTWPLACLVLEAEYWAMWVSIWAGFLLNAACF